MQPMIPWERGMSLRACYWANWPAVETILPAWFRHLQDSFSHDEVSLKQFSLPLKPVAFLLKMWMKPLLSNSIIEIFNILFEGDKNGS